MDDSHVVLDIETIPADADEREEEPEEDTFPPLVWQRIVSIGILWLDRDLRFKRLGTVAEGKSEAEVLGDLHGFMDKYRPLLVTFNGRRFDMPVIVMRSLVHGQVMRWYFASQDYRKRYAPNRHIDLCDTLSEHGAGRFPSLGDMASAIGLPGKLGMDGSDVLPAYRRGELDRIHAYCLMDVIQTGFVLMRWRLVTGRMDVGDYRDAAVLLRDKVSEDSRFGELVSASRWDEVLLGP